MRIDKKNSRVGEYKTGVQDEAELFYPDKKNEFFCVGVLHPPSRKREYTPGTKTFFCDDREGGARDVRAGIQ